MKEQVVIIGAGGFGREVLDVIDACNQEKERYEPLGFIVDAQYGSSGTLVNDLPILGGFEWLEKNAKKVKVTCGIGVPHHRFHLIKRAIDIGCSFFSLIHPSVIMTRWIQVKEGVVITAGSILTNNIYVGNYVHINLDCTIGHDSIFQDYVTVAPGVHISGNVSLEEGCYIGTGTNIIEKTNIGSWSIVGAGSAIVTNVPANTTVVGVPGKVIKKREVGWHLK